MLRILSQRRHRQLKCFFLIVVEATPNWLAKDLDWVRFWYMQVSAG